MSEQYWLGIDPGAGGGFALVDRNGQIRPSHVWKRPELEGDIRDLFKYGFKGQVQMALIEKVHAMPGQGVVSMFKFGMGYGFLRGMLIAYEIPFQEIAPVTWQRYQHCLTHGDKNISKAKAWQLWPNVKVTHAIADAMLIAKHCREDDLGLLAQPVKVVRGPVKPKPGNADLEHEFTPTRKIPGQKVIGDDF